MKIWSFTFEIQIWLFKLQGVKWDKVVQSWKVAIKEGDDNRGKYTKRNAKVFYVKDYHGDNDEARMAAEVLTIQVWEINHLMRIQILK